MAKGKINYGYWLLCLILCLCTLFTFLMPNTVPYSNVSADVVKYSNVLVDLSKDENFNLEQYPAKEDDYSLRVIQVAEGVNGDLFVYVYQPAVEKKLLPATCINMANDLESQDFHLHDLELINKNRTLVKYKVKDFEVNKERYYRYYNIASIYRKWYEGIDKDTGNDNTINEVSFAVGKKWTTYTLNDKVFYDCTDIETVLITSKYVDFVRYKNASNLFLRQLDSHFVAFSTDKKIENLIEVDIAYVKYLEIESFLISGLIPVGITKGKPEEKEITLLRDQEVDVSLGWLFPTKDKYNRIEKTSDFIKKNDDLSDEVKRNLLGKDWVLRFVETDYFNGQHQGNYSINQRTAIDEVTILRLKFETEGETYNVGVVDNKQSGDNLPGNKTGWPWWVWLIIAIVAIVFVSILLATLVPKLFALIVEGIVKVVTWIVKGLWWLITLPFKAAKKNKEKGD